VSPSSQMTTAGLFNWGRPAGNGLQVVAAPQAPPPSTEPMSVRPATSSPASPRSDELPGPHEAAANSASSATACARTGGLDTGASAAVELRIAAVRRMDSAQSSPPSVSWRQAAGERDGRARTRVGPKGWRISGCPASSAGARA
jgi:hypothetical protein